jgi:phage tail sheath gpL-like
LLYRLPKILNDADCFHTSRHVIAAVTGHQQTAVTTTHLFSISHDAARPGTPEAALAVAFVAVRAGALSSQPGRTLGVLALVLALRLAWRARKQARLVRDLNKIGTGKKNEWDVIIVGGGRYLCAAGVSED